MAAASTSAGRRGNAGWVVLAAGFAVFSALIFNWWSHLRVAREKGLASKARGRIPSGGMFQSARGAAKLVNPIGPLPAVASTTVITANAPVNATASSLNESIEVSAPPILELKRDPMLSPFDLLRLQEEADRERLALQRLEDERNRRSGSRVRKSPETSVTLQGIISSPEGDSKAIVNGEVVGEGQRIGRIRVVRITASSVIFEHQGRKFTKVINSD